MLRGKFIEKPFVFLNYLVPFFFGAGFLVFGFAVAVALTSVVVSGFAVVELTGFVGVVVAGLGVVVAAGFGVAVVAGAVVFAGVVVPGVVVAGVVGTSSFTGVTVVVGSTSVLLVTVATYVSILSRVLPV